MSSGSARWWTGKASQRVPIDARDPDVRKLLADAAKQRHTVATLAGMLGLKAVAPPAKDARAWLLETMKEGAQDPESESKDPTP